MTNTLNQIKFGISKDFPCSYLPDQNERLLVVMDDRIYTHQGYEALMNLGFRRSGEQVYRPHCETCQACESIRIPVNDFKPSRSQKRTEKKCIEFTVRLNPVKDVSGIYFDLYSRYINQRHTDSSMYPPNFEQYINFIQSNWLNVQLLEIYHLNQLISVTVLDVLPDSFSAVYTFFDPDYSHYSLGRFAILQMIELARISRRHYVYLGYQVDACQKMNYKTEYKPHQRYVGGHWIDN